MDDLKTIGRRVAALRQRARVTQYELADIIGVARGTIASIEAGVDRAGIITTVAIVDHFRVSLDWLLGREPSSRTTAAAPYGDNPVAPYEHELLAAYRSVDKQGRAMILRFARSLRNEDTRQREAAE